jgi:hypothetical protein
MYIYSSSIINKKIIITHSNKIQHFGEEQPKFTSKNKDKGKVVSVHNVMKTYAGVQVKLHTRARARTHTHTHTHTHILNIETKGRSAVRFTLWPLYHSENNRRYPLNRRL